MVIRRLNTPDSRGAFYQIVEYTSESHAGSGFVPDRSHDMLGSVDRFVYTSARPTYRRGNGTSVAARRFGLYLGGTRSKDYPMGAFHVCHFLGNGYLTNQSGI